MPPVKRALVLYQAYTVGYAFWLVALTVGGIERDVVNDIVSMPIYFVPGLVLCGSAWAKRGERRVAWAVGILGAGWAAPGLSFALALLPGWERNPFTFAASWGLYFAFYPLMLIGLGLLAISPAERAVRVRLALDSGLVVVAAATMQWYFVTRMHPGGSPLLEIIGDLGILFPTELLIAFGAAILVYRPVEAGAAPWPRVLGVGMFLSTTSDFVYQYRKLTEQRWPGTGGDLLFALAGAFVITAGAQILRPVGTPAAAKEVPSGLTSLPHVAIAFIGGLLIWEAVRAGLTDPVAGLVLGGTLLVALLIMRLALEQRASAVAQERQAALDARFRALVHRSTDAILVVDPRGEIAYASPAFGRVVDTAGPIHGQPLRALVPEAPADLVQLADVGAPQRWTISRAEGPRALDVVVTDLRRDPAVSGFVVNLRDVTQQVELEQRLRSSQKLEIVGRMASSVAHDFNNVLTVVMGNAALALSDPNEPSRRHWEAVLRAAERGAALARQLLSIGRPAQGAPGRCNLTEELRRSVDTLRSILPSSLEIRLTTPAEPLHSPIATGEVERVLLNLALNARDATEGTGLLTLSLERSPDGRARLRVADTGSGMDDATLQRALEPFFTTKAPHSGTGLGLSTVLEIIKKSGGDLDINSRQGEGTTVTITLPLLDDVTLPVSAETPTNGEISRGRGRVLVVDDEPAVRAVVCRYLTTTGFTVLQATNGVHALEVLHTEAWTVDAMLTDLVMPQMSGPELIRRVRARDPYLPILCMSGNGLSPADAATAATLAAPVIQKPPALARLSAQLIEVIGNRRPS